MNRGSAPAEAFVREGIERYDDNEWKIIDSTVPAEPLGANTVQFKSNSSGRWQGDDHLHGRK